MLLFEFGLQLPGHNDFTINDGFHQQPPAQTGDCPFPVIYHSSHGTLSSPLQAKAPIGCKERNFSPADELFLSLHANFLPVANEKMKGEQTFALGISLTEGGGNCPGVGTGVAHGYSLYPFLFPCF